MADDVRPRTRSSTGAPRCNQPPPKKVARSRAVAPKTGADTTTPPPKNKIINPSSDSSKIPALTISPQKGLPEKCLNASLSIVAPLRSIFDDDHVEKIPNGSRSKMKCLWCGTIWPEAHATRMIGHLLQRPGMHVKPCLGKIDEQKKKIYQDFFDRKNSTKIKKKRVHESVADSQGSLAQALVASRNHPLPCPPLNKGQTSIFSGFDRAVSNDIRRSNDAQLEMAIADFFHCENIADRVVESTRFKYLLKQARLVGGDFRPPTRQKIRGELLSLNFQVTYDKNITKLLQNADVFGLGWLGDGATIKRMPLLNILVLCGEASPTVVSIVDCTSHMSDGGKKDATYIMEQFRIKVDEIDVERKLTDCFFFDGASNVQTAGAILCARYPRAMCFHGGEHVLSLFFSDLSKIKPIQLLVIKCCRLYNVFGSGASHGIYAQFIAQAAAFNNGKTIGLLRGAGTRFATWFYAMHRALRMKPALKATIHNPSFASLTRNDRVAAAINDIEDEVFWKAIYCLLRAVFPALKALRYCDSNVPAMDKIFFLVKRADDALQNSQMLLDDQDLFGSMRGMTISDCDEEMDEVFGELNTERNDEILSDDDDNDEFTLGDAIQFAWHKRKNRLEHAYAVTAWALALQPDIRADCMERLSTDNGSLRMMVDEVVSRLHYPPCPNKKVVNKSIDEIIDIFWKEFKHFTFRTGPYSYRSSRFENDDALAGRSHLWHEMHSLPFTEVLGFVACRTTSKRLGIGSAERSWSDVKTIKNGKRANIGGDTLEKRAILYTSAKLEEAQLLRSSELLFDAFGDNDLKFDLQLEDWGIDTTQLKEPAITRRIKGWTEEWEKERHKKNDAVSKAMFVNKYKDTVFDLPDAGNNTFYVGEDEIAWVRGRDGGWTIFGVCDVDGVEDEQLTPFLAISLIRQKPQKEGIVIEMPDPGSDEEKVWGSDDFDNT